MPLRTTGQLRAASILDRGRRSHSPSRQRAAGDSIGDVGGVRIGLHDAGAGRVQPPKSERPEWPSGEYTASSVAGPADECLRLQVEQQVRRAVGDVTALMPEHSSAVPRNAGSASDRPISAITESRAHLEGSDVRSLNTLVRCPGRRPVWMIGTGRRGNGSDRRIAPASFAPDDAAREPEGVRIARARATNVRTGYLRRLASGRLSSSGRTTDSPAEDRHTTARARRSGHSRLAFRRPCGPQN